MQNLVDVDKNSRIRARGRKSSDETLTASQTILFTGYPRTGHARPAGDGGIDITQTKKQFAYIG